MIFSPIAVKSAVESADLRQWLHCLASPQFPLRVLEIKIKRRTSAALF